MQEDNTNARPMQRPNADAIAAHVTPFPAFTSDSDEWLVSDAVYQYNAEYLARVIDSEVQA